MTVPTVNKCCCFRLKTGGILISLVEYVISAVILFYYLRSWLYDEYSNLNLCIFVATGECIMTSFSQKKNVYNGATPSEIKQPYKLMLLCLQLTFIQITNDNKAIVSIQAELKLFKSQIYLNFLDTFVCMDFISGDCNTIKSNQIKCYCLISHIV